MQFDGGQKSGPCAIPQTRARRETSTLVLSRRAARARNAFRWRAPAPIETHPRRPERSAQIEQSLKSLFTVQIARVRGVVSRFPRAFALERVLCDGLVLFACVLMGGPRFDGRGGGACRAHAPARGGKNILKRKRKRKRGVHRPTDPPTKHTHTQTKKKADGMEGRRRASARGAPRRAAARVAGPFRRPRRRRARRPGRVSPGPPAKTRRGDARPKKKEKKKKRIGASGRCPRARAAVPPSPPHRCS